MDTTSPRDTSGFPPAILRDVPPLLLTSNRGEDLGVGRRTAPFSVYRAGLGMSLYYANEQVFRRKIATPSYA